MIDLAGIANLFFEASKEWREPKVARIDPLEDIENEQIFKDLKAKGHTFEWAKTEHLRRLKREGWAPVHERDAIGRPTIFMDRLQELILIHRLAEK